MSKRSERAYLDDMLEYARKAHQAVAGRTFEAWHADEHLRYSVFYLIQVVGEAASRLSDATRSSLAGIPWQQIVNMRNRLVHGYGDIRPEIVWQIATTDLPVLIATLEQINLTEP